MTNSAGSKPSRETLRFRWGVSDYVILPKTLLGYIGTSSEAKYRVLRS